MAAILTRLSSKKSCLNLFSRYVFQGKYSRMISTFISKKSNTLRDPTKYEFRWKVSLTKVIWFWVCNKKPTSINFNVKLKLNRNLGQIQRYLCVSCKKLARKNYLLTLFGYLIDTDRFIAKFIPFKIFFPKLIWLFAKNLFRKRSSLLKKRGKRQSDILNLYLSVQRAWGLVYYRSNF